MRYFIRPLIALLTFITGLTVVATWSVLRPSTPPSQPDSPLSVAISPIEFFGWWHEKQSGVRSNDDPVDSNVYRQLESWRTDDESQADQIDVVYHLENRGSRSVDLMVLAIGEFSISPDGLAAGSDEPRRHSTLLSERQNIGQRIIHDLAPGETRELKFTCSNLRSILNKYLRKEYGTLKPWELRVNIDVRTLDNRQVAQQRGRLQLTLGR
jgi:hypothetical protein